MRLAYIVSRFPHLSETFIVRELDAVSGFGAEIELFSLFPAIDSTVHPAARAWVTRLWRCGPFDALRGLAWWLAHRPLRTLSSVLLLVHGHARRPRTLLRALATVPIASAHARMIKRLGVDHVHAHYATYPALAAWLCRRLTGIPYSFTAHAHDLFVDRSHLAHKVADAGFVVAISEYNRRSLAALEGGGETPVHIVRCGIDPTAYAYRPRGPRPRGPVWALCVASLQEYKGHRVLLEALADGGPPPLERVHLELIGEGPLRRPLEELAHRLGIGARVSFRGGLPEPEVTAALEGADLFVLPSVVAGNGQMEGVPVALMEALACGLPTVATRLSGVPELVRDGRTGLLAEPGDVRGLREALSQTLADPPAARERAEAGRRLVESEFELRASARRLAHLFDGAGSRS
jgi:colanic acid/amylovoran biosynthesis glycosyltransferase